MSWMLFEDLSRSIFPIHLFIQIVERIQYKIIIHEIEKCLAVKMLPSVASPLRFSFYKLFWKHVLHSSNILQYI